ncbi:transcription termination/antitermination NusG family protein [Rhizobium sp. NFR03]|uniref:transcription termination/antitermination protein NusG n=1 Tax=Rhizobium sp. NFR03 TaxID=1566263 RepID=UPI00147B126D|nr:transcription termination/antitermination NusG family protein [Rhizobium sp. NFR03]
MNMQHRNGEFDKAQAIEIRPYAEFKQEKARRENRIRISQLASASRRIAEDYPDLAAWLCFRLRSRCEFAVEEALLSEDVHALVPRRKGEETRRRGRVIPAPTLPVLPGYVLVRCVPSASAIQGVLHFDSQKRISGVIGGGGHVHRVPDRLMSKFIQKADHGAYDHRDPDPVRYVVGETVLVTEGPFSRFHGVVLAQDVDRNRIRVEVRIFNGCTPMELDVADVEKV